MCGICGIVNFDPSATVDPSLLRRMTSALFHRGPDDSGYLLEKNVGLGHRRLSIIDLSGGKQPIFNEDRSAAIIFNGEIYNYADLTKDLISRSHQFTTHSDTETILHAYEEYGDRCVDQLRGMFAFAIWDQKRQQLFAARDRLGVKPFYYFHGKTFFAFSSELKSLLEMSGVPRELDMQSLDLYLSLRYVPGPRTMFRNIYKLQPGHRLKLSGGKLHIEKYWDLPVATSQNRNDNDVLREFNELLEESVRLRLISEVPLGVFLSGGLDSSTILATMSKITNRKRIKTFSVGYDSATSEEESANEFDYARLVAQKFGSEHHEYRVGAQEFCDAIPKLIWHLDEPVADPSCIPLYFISKAAREQITVVLSGEGADETLAGYSIYQKMLHIEKFQKIVRLPGCSLAGRVGAWFPDAKFGRFSQLAAQPLESQYRGVSRAFHPWMRQQLLKSFGDEGFEKLLDKQFAPYWKATGGRNSLDRMLYLDTKVWLADDILLKADKMSMAHSLEMRVPFLDHKLVEFAAKLPTKFKLRGGSGKFLLRKAMSGQLPEEIIRRPKKGFPVPIEQWLRGPMKDYTQDTLLSSQSASRQLFNADFIKNLLREHQSGSAKRHEEIWSLLVFESWNRMFLTQPSTGATNQRLEEIGVA
jgi:asparagine synthase (glutamine-hydrolysing)